MPSSLYQRWVMLIETLYAEAHERTDRRDDMIERIQTLIQSCPFQTIEAQLWALHDQVACSVEQ
jgi:hypothetical protein